MLGISVIFVHIHILSDQNQTYFLELISDNSRIIQKKKKILSDNFSIFGLEDQSEFSNFRLEF